MKQRAMPAGRQGNVGLIILVVVLVVLGLWWLMKSGYKFPQQTASVMTKSDLDMAAKDLDGTNLNEMDPGISQVTADSSSF